MLILKNSLKFILKGEYNENTYNIFKNLKIIIKEYFFILISYIVIIALLSSMGMLDSGKSPKKLTDIMPEGVALFMVIILAPFIEEVVFRLPLKVKKANILIANLTASLFVYISLEKRFGDFTYLLLPISITVGYITLYKFEYIIKLLNDKQVWLVHILSWAFCLAHFGNYHSEINPSTITYMFLILIHGYFYSYIRLRFGIGYSIFAHSFNNILMSLPIIIKFLTQ